MAAVQILFCLGYAVVACGYFDLYFDDNACVCIPCYLNHLSRFRFDITGAFLL